MDWTSDLQRAIDYIEDHLTGELDYEEIAAKANVSSFYFQRLFSLVTGMSVGEYIRSRRMSLAGSDLASSSLPVIEVAFRYGYKTPESFTRAFTRFHGLTPRQAKKKGAPLKSFSRLSLHLALKGGCIMDYRIEKRKAFSVIEKVKMFSTVNELNLKEIPLFWSKSKKDGTISTLCEYAGGEGPKNIIFGICYGEGCQTEFPYSIAVSYDGKKPIPSSFRVHEIPKETWAIFPCIGAMPTAIQRKWKEIYLDFFPTSDFIPKNEIDFEVYPEGDLDSPNYVSEIWIAVKKKA